MLDGKLVSQIQDISRQAGATAEQYSGVFGSAKGFILENFGQSGLIAAYIAVAALAVFLISRLAKITFSTLKYMIIPAAALAFVGSFFLPYSFFALLPVTVTASSLILLFKG
jgi:hypothetical protein